MAFGDTDYEFGSCNLAELKSINQSINQKVCTNNKNINDASNLNNNTDIFSNL